MQRTIIAIVFLVLIAVFASGCDPSIYGKAEIDKVEFIRVVAIDRTQGEHTGVRITITSKKAETGTREAGGGEPEVANTMSVEGETVFEAIRKFSTFTDKNLFFGHVEFILIGEDAAKEDVLKYLDFFVRDHELRLNAKVIVVRDGTAKEVIDTGNTSEHFISERLNILMDAIGANSLSAEVELVKLLQMFDNEFASAYLPSIRLSNLIDREKGEEEKKDLLLDRFAVFQGGRLLGYLSEEQSRGLNWIINKIQTGIIVVTDKRGGKVSLEIIDSRSKIIPSFNKDMPEVLIKIGLSSNVGEIQSSEDVFNIDTISYLQHQQENIVKSEIENVLMYGQKNNVDIFGLSTAIYHRYPIKWKSVQGEWQEIFPKLKINIVVESKINRTYNIRTPITRKSGDK
ncbi:spore germination protein KC [Clostridium aceticum]|uniref:Spore germination protein KC n=1 Tax=Clostridium aceticum TaxID=84022 RepID=A0A0D8I9V9_9CLOT|nr:Ger(x)C family spore germination protein [Clostridium aceticum]AKL96010.1 spore germination protein KC [Clostridium aceticum]KJF27053.1 hypothetical protein TZ02_09610 [Clostridium aceticum]